MQQFNRLKMQQIANYRYSCFKTRWDGDEESEDTKCFIFSLSGENGKNKNDWKLKSQGQPADPDLPVKWPLKRCVRVCVLLINDAKYERRREN